MSQQESNLASRTLFQQIIACTKGPLLLALGTCLVLPRIDGDAMHFNLLGSREGFLVVENLACRTLLQPIVACTKGPLLLALGTCLVLPRIDGDAMHFNMLGSREALLAALLNAVKQSIPHMIIPATLVNLGNFKQSLDFPFAYKQHDVRLQNIMEPTYHQEQKLQLFLPRSTKILFRFPSRSSVLSGVGRGQSDVRIAPK
ncbi:hypothetical protein BDC45DRAFT_539040 [Circinella umbellata]|nr:hypothetical protein BDC45DRAFT_539040 [Circinella umbellata]